MKQIQENILSFCKKKAKKIFVSSEKSLIFAFVILKTIFLP